MRPSDLFPVQSSTLSASALHAEVLSQYDLPEPVSCALHLKGDNDTYRVQAGAQVHFLRVYTHKKGSDQNLQIATEVDLLEIAHAAGVPVSRALPKKDGSYLTLLAAPEGLRHAVLFEGVPGEVPGVNLTPDQARIFGAWVGKLHHAWQSVDQVLPIPTHDATALLENPLRKISPYLEHRPDDLLFVQQVVDQVSIQLTLLPDHGGAYGVIHGDLHKTNLLVTASGLGENQLHLIDFNVVGYGWRAHDLAVLLWSTGVVGDFEPRPIPEVFVACLEGYETVRPLEKAEKEALPFLAMAQHLWIMGVEIDQVENGLWGSQWVTSEGWFTEWIEKLREWVRLTGEQTGFAPK